MLHLKCFSVFWRKKKKHKFFDLLQIFEAFFFLQKILTVTEIFN